MNSYTLQDPIIMRKANATIWKLGSPVVRFDDLSEEIFLHEGTLIMFHSEYYDVDEDPGGTIHDAQGNGEILNHPIDEYGETHSEVGHCPIIGRAGDTVSPYHGVIMHYIKAQDPESIPGNYERIRKTLERYGIGIRDEERENLRMSVWMLEDSSTYRFGTGNPYPEYLPFSHTYRKEEFSDELLAKDIAATLGALFGVVHAPVKRLVLGVDNLDGSRYNENVARLLNGSGEFGFEIVSPAPRLSTSGKPSSGPSGR